MIAPNPRNCYTCEFGEQHSELGKAVCTIILPKWLTSNQLPKTITNPQDECPAFKAKKGTFARICLNCGNPIRTHHKYTMIGEKQWIHKFCDHPESPSRFHYEKYHRGADLQEGGE